ncbi:hypothetical protein [Fluviicola sp.]|uniref:hypothetical protein n=1 Tax=Fluviicola sp. TaxID=1917219 RepID=UPI0026193E83|nr:hypothetical protein [Fluviicola sp.]
MLKSWKSKVWLILITCAGIISYPFFTIKYFETATALLITAKFLLLSILVCLMIFGPKFYYKKVKPLDKNIPKNKLKEKARDVISIAMIIICLSGVLFGMGFSFIITTNQFFGKSEVVQIKEPVKGYSHSTKNGRLKHYIVFKNPKTQKTIELEVYRKYDVGEIFEKNMKCGAWGILYATK